MRTRGAWQRAAVAANVVGALRLDHLELFSQFDEAMEELRREVDIFINSFLKQEGLEGEKQEWLKQLLDEVKALGEELVLALLLLKDVSPRSCAHI